MNVENYVKKLVELSPSIKALEARKLSVKLIEMYSSSLILIPNNEKIKEDNPIIHIIKNYDISQFCIIDFRFLQESNQVSDYLIFGESEADSMAITDYGEIVKILYTDVGEYELDNSWEITHITPCSKNSETFLEALKIAAELQSRRFSGDVKGNDFEKNQSYAERCITVSGGEKYRQFWWSFLNCEEY